MRDVQHNGHQMGRHVGQDIRQRGMAELDCLVCFTQGEQGSKV